MRRARTWLLAAFVLVLGCGETGSRRVSFPVAAAGTAPETISVGAWDVEVREARVAFGPVYLCSARSAGLESCAHAAAEHLGASTFDALDGAPTPMGLMVGTSGVTVLSGMWDYGRAWRLSEVEPRPLEGAVDGARSAVLEIAATRALDGTVRIYRFALDVDGRAQASGSTAVRARLPEHTIAQDEAGLVARFDPTLWASMLDYDALALLPEPTPGAAISVPAEHPAAGALTIALTTTGLPTFEWAAP